MINTQLDGSGKIICAQTICLTTIKTFMKMNKNISSPINKCMFKTWSPLCSRTFWRWMGGGGGFCYTDSRQLRHRHHLLPRLISLKVWSPPSQFVPSSRPPQSTGPLPFYQIFSTNKFPLNISHQIFVTTNFPPNVFHPFAIKKIVNNFLLKNSSKDFPKFRYLHSLLGLVPLDFNMC